MPQVSKFRIRPDVWEKVFDMFLESFLNNKNKKEINLFVNGLFTPVERIMFAKRFAACLLLAKGQDYRSVARTLRMSPSTIAKMSFKLKYEGDYINPTINKIIKKQSYEIFYKQIQDLLDLPIKGQNFKARNLRRSKRLREIEVLQKGI